MAMGNTWEVWGRRSRDWTWDGTAQPVNMVMVMDTTDAAAT